MRTTEEKKMGGQKCLVVSGIHKLTEAEISGKMTNSMQNITKKKEEDPRETRPTRAEQLYTREHTHTHSVTVKESTKRSVFDVFFGS